MTPGQKLYRLYEGSSEEAHRFRYGLLAFDIVTIFFLIVSSFFHWRGTEVLDFIIGVVILADLAARFWISRQKARFFLNVYGVIDVVVAASLLAPFVGEGLAFLRVARAFRLLRSYQLLRRLRQDVGWFARHEQTVFAALNLAIFIFVMTALVYETQHFSNDQINNYADALYFTVTALTTTGFGDIVLKGTWGRLISVIIMVFGVSLFLRLVQVLLRPEKVEHKCPHCGLKRHDHDAIHCKHCGNLLAIEDEGAV